MTVRRRRWPSRRFGLLLLAVACLLPRPGVASNDVLTALAEARKQASAQPEAVAPQLEIARLLARLGAIDEARVAVATVIEKAPERVEPYRLAALLLRDADRLDEAIGTLDAALAAGVDSPDVRADLAALHLAQGDATAALAAVEAAAAAMPDHADLHLMVGLALAADPARRSEAGAPLERALALGVARSGRAHRALGSLRAEAGDLEAARHHLEAARDAQPDDPETWYRLGNVLRTAGDLEGARQALERFQSLSRAADAADHGAKALGAALNEAQALALDNRLPEALAQVRTLLEAHPDAPSILALEAKINFSLGERDAALDGMARAAAGAPANAEFHYLEGRFAVALGRLDRARAALARAVAVDTDLGDAHHLLGLVLAQQGQFADAEPYLAQALVLGVDGAAFRRAYAEVLKRLGRTAESDAQMEAYRRLGGG